MQLPQTILFLLALFTLGQALALPGSLNDLSEASKQLFKRKGGGGGGGRGGGGTSSSSSSSSGGSRSGGSSSSSSSSSTSSGSRTSSGGSGTPRSYGGGRFYGGGASTPYRSGGSRSGLGAPVLVGAGALAVLPAFALYGAYSYGYPYYWAYRNNTSGQNVSHPAQCWCSQGQDCSCAANNDTDYQNSVANDANQTKLVRLPGNDTDTLIVNGTVDSDTVAPTENGAMGFKEMMGYWPVIAVAVATAFAL